MENLATIEWVVPDMECEGCVRTLQRVLTSLSGVHAVNADLPTKHLTVHYNPQRIAPSQIHEAIVSAGFTPQE